MKSSALPSPPRRASLAAAIAVVMLLPAAGCHTTPLLAPTESTITLAINPLVVPLNGTAEIIATVIEMGGTAVQNGTLVIFTTTLGTIEPREARTSNGVVTVRLNAGGQSGVATISAISGNAVETLEEAVTIGGAAVTTLVLTANPSVVRSTGGTVQIVALVTDDNGNRIAGVPVTFTTDAGRLSNTVVPTNPSGEARVTLTTIQEATVTANAGGQSDEVTVTVTDGPLLTLSVSAAPTAGEATVFTVDVTAGSNPIRSVRIQFGDGSAQSLGALGDGGTDVSHVYRRAGTFLVTVTATDIGERTSITTPVVVAAQAPLSVTLATTTTLTAPPISVAFTATVEPTGTPIRRYDWTFGDGTSLSTSGASTSHVYSSSGTLTVKVTAVAVDGRTATAQIQIVIAEATPLSVTISRSPSTTLTAPVTVTFTASVTPTASITNHAWDFGDGTEVSTGSSSITNHNYTSAETVTVFVTITAGDGRTATGRLGRD